MVQSPEQEDQPGLRPNRACRACVTIKAKCIPRNGSDLSVCERCYRLGKECTTPVPRKRARRQNPEVVQLQEEVQALTKALHAQKQFEIPTPAASEDQQDSSQQVSNRARIQESQGLNAYEYFPKGRGVSTGTIYDISPELGPFTASDHEQLFEQYKANMAKFFPFVAIERSLPIAAVMKTRPFVYTCCVMVASHRDPAVQIRIARDILKYVGEHMLLHSEKTLDLLQGLLLMIAWHHSYSHNNPQLTNLVFLAEALVVDLGLIRPTSLNRIPTEPTAMNNGYARDVESVKHNLDESRAYLGFYFSRSKFSGPSRRLDPPQWKTYSDECCQRLEDAVQLDTDLYVVALVRLRRLLHQYTETIKPGTAMPLQAYMRLVTADMERYNNSLSAELRKNRYLCVEIRSVELHLLEPVIAAHCQHPLQKVEALYVCLNKVNSYFDAFLSFELKDLSSFPFVASFEMSHAFEILEKLSFLKLDGWDTDFVRNNSSFIGLVDRLSARLLEAQSYEEKMYPPLRSQRLKMFAARAERFKTWYQNKIALEAQQPMVDSSHSDGRDSVSEDPLLPLTVTDFSDFSWQDLISDWPRFGDDDSINLDGLDGT